MDPWNSHLVQIVSQSLPVSMKLVLTSPRALEPRPLTCEANVLPTGPPPRFEINWYATIFVIQRDWIFWCGFDAICKCVTKVAAKCDRGVQRCSEFAKNNQSQLGPIHLGIPLFNVRMQTVWRFNFISLHRISCKHSLKDKICWKDRCNAWIIFSGGGGGRSWIIYQGMGT